MSAMSRSSGPPPSSAGPQGCRVCGWPADHRAIARAAGNPATSQQRHQARAGPWQRTASFGTSRCSTLSGLCGPARRMADAENNHLRPVNVIADNVRIGTDNLPHGCSWHAPASMREMVQAVPQRPEARSDLPGGPGIELLEIGPDGSKMRQRWFSPNNLVQLGAGLGQGNSSGVPHESSHLATSACGTNRPAR